MSSFNPGENDHQQSTYLENITDLADFEAIRRTHLIRLNEWLTCHGYEGVILSRRDNFAWITAGCENAVVSNTENGIAHLAIGRETLDLFADSSDLPRMNYENNPLGAQPHLIPWYESMEDALEDFVDNYNPAENIPDFMGYGDTAMLAESMGIGTERERLPWVSDTGIAGTQNVLNELVQLRMKLCADEIELYKETGRLCTQAVEETCREIKPGDTEWQAAALLKDKCTRLGISPDCVLVGADERLEAFRHPYPTQKPIRHCAMIVLGGQKYGLNISLTRFVGFGEVPPQIHDLMDRTGHILAGMECAMKDGLSYSDFFSILQDLYEDQGVPYEWTGHHQGGPTGYANREFIITPQTEGKIHTGEAFAWNPSLPGAKCEDTTILTQEGILILTDSGTWPRHEARTPYGSYSYADILIRERDEY